MSSPVQLFGLRRTSTYRLLSGVDEPGQQQQCSQSRMFPGKATPSVCVPRVSHSFPTTPRRLQDQQGRSGPGFYQTPALAL